MPAHSDQSKGMLGRPRDPELDERILAAALNHLRERGYRELSMEQVACAAGVGKATVYRWWHSKSSLVIEAISRRLDGQVVQPTGDTRADLRAFIQRIADTYTSSDLGEVLLALAVDVAHDPQGNGLLGSLLGQRRAASAALLYSAAARGDLPHDLDAPLILDIISGTIAYQVLLGRRPVPEVLDKLTDLILEGRVPRS